MFSAINILLAILWFISALIDYSEYCYLWQLKEYRVDRLRDFFSTKVGQSYWKRYSIAWRSALALLAKAVILSPLFNSPSKILTYAITPL